MNWSQFKNPMSHMCFAGDVVASWSLTQEVASSNPFTVMTNIFVTEFAELNCLNFCQGSDLAMCGASPDRLPSIWCK